MIYSIPWLFGWWNGLVIEWKQDDNKRSGDLWHIVGRIVLAMCALFLIIQNMPDWYGYILNPVQAINGTDLYKIILSGAVFFCMSWSPYNMIINLVNEWKWWYIGRGRDFKLYWTLIAISYIFTILFGIFARNI